MTAWHYTTLGVVALLSGAVAYVLRKRDSSPSSSAPAPLGPHGPPVAKVSPEMTAWAKELLNDASFPLGSETSRDFDGATVVAVAETHTWYGADPTRASTPHKGISLYYARES